MFFSSVNGCHIKVWNFHCAPMNVHKSFGLVVFFLSVFLLCPSAFAQIPPLPGTNTLTLPSRKKRKSIHVIKKRPPRRAAKKKRFPSPHAKYVFLLGQKFQKLLPRGWRMDWDPTSLRKIQWQAGSQFGYQIRFIHVSKKVPVPVPFPNFKRSRGNTVLVPMRCTLHFFPLQGTYKAYDNRVNRMTPATIIAITQKSIVMRPDRFLAKEFPCPDIIQKFHRFTRSSHRGSPAPRSWYRKLKRLGFPNVKIRQHRYHVSVSIPGSQRPVPTKQLLNYFRKPTLVVRFKDKISNWITIYNR